MDIVTLGAALKGAKSYTDATIAPLLGGVHYRGSVNYFSNLPSNPSDGDAYTVKYTGSSGTTPDGTEYVWGLDTDDNTYKWIGFSPDTYTKTEIDTLLNGKQNTIDSTHKISADNVDDSNTTNKFTNESEKQTWNGKQDALTQTQLDAANSGIDSTKVAQIATNTANIALIQGEVQNADITITDMNGYAVGTVKTGYVDGVADITGYVTIRTYAEPNSRKMQIIEAQEGTTKTRYYNGTTWTDFENSLSEKVDSMSSVISSILIHGTQSWDTVQSIVRAGLAPEYYPVGTLLYDNMNPSSGVAFRVVGYDNFFDETLTAQGYSHSMTLLEEVLNYPEIQFDAPEAWLYLSYDGQDITGGESGQQYKFTIPNYDTAYGGGKSYVFTVPANATLSKESAEGTMDGGQLTLTWNYNQNPSAVSAYASPSATTAAFSITGFREYNAETDTGAIDLGTIKNAMTDADSAYGKLNHVPRARYGSNNYYQSGIRQWLNATTASDWWQPSNIFDRPYVNRTSAGRLSTLDSAMTAKIATPTITCITNNVFEYGADASGTAFAKQTQYTVKDKLFLLTHSEVGLSSAPDIGSALAYYVGAANSKRTKYKTDGTTAQHWWLRTPYPSSASSERYVHTSGALYTSYSAISLGSAAACVIQ